MATTQRHTTSRRSRKVVVCENRRKHTAGQGAGGMDIPVHARDMAVHHVLGVATGLCKAGWNSSGKHMKNLGTQSK